MSHGRRLLGVGLVAMLGLVFAGPAAAKPNADRTLVVGQAVPDATPDANGALTSTIELGKKFSGRRIRDVNVGLSFSAPFVEDYAALLTAPNGATVQLVGLFDTQGTSWGMGETFLTLDDESPLEMIFDPPDEPGLPPPYAGSASPGTNIPLAIMDDGRARGPWTLTIEDFIQGEVGVLGSWRLQVRTGKPYATRDG